MKRPHITLCVALAALWLGACVASPTPHPGKSDGNDQKAPDEGAAKEDTSAADASGEPGGGGEVPGPDAWNGDSAPPIGDGDAISVAETDGDAGGDGETADAQDGQAQDAEVQDSGPDIPAFCGHLSLATKPITALALVDPLEPHGARSFRVRMSHPMSCYERWAMPRITVDTENKEVRLVARVWVEPWLCAAADAEVERLLTLTLAQPGTWTLTDATVEGGVTLSVDIDPPPGDPCAAEPGTGACTRDCDCAGSALCLSAEGDGGPFLACAEPCELDLDCSAGRCTSVDDGFESTCRDPGTGCDAGRPCPEGYVCDEGDCQPDFVLNASARPECSCDSECEAPLRCVLPEGDASKTGRCERPCTGARGMPTPSLADRWCGAMHVCGEASHDVSGLAVSDAVCGWVGE